MESLCKGGSIDGKLWYSEARHAASCNLKRFAHEYGVFNEKRLPLPNMIPRRLHKEIACITFATSELNDYRSYGNLKQRIYFTLYTKQAHSVTILTWKGKVACCKSLSFEFWNRAYVRRPRAGYKWDATRRKSVYLEHIFYTAWVDTCVH